MINQLIRLNKAIYLLILLSFCFTSKAQHSIELAGKIVTEKGEVISFCNIIIKHHPTKGVVSDYDGNFTIKANINDTLITSYIGYKTTDWVVRDTTFANLILTPSTISLPEFTVKSGKILTAKQVVTKTLKNWKKNHLTHEKNKTYRIEVFANFLIDKNQQKIYSYDGNVDLIGYDNRIYANLKDTTYRYQTEFVPSRIYSLSGGSPYRLLIPQIFFQLFVNKKYSFEFGSIEYYNNQPVYHIKFNNKRGNGICEGGGYYLISKTDFSLLYIETVTKDCVAFNNEHENMEWKYAIVRTFFDKKIDSKRYVTKVENEIRYKYIREGSISDYYYKNKLIINKINLSQSTVIDKQQLGYAEDIFYKKPNTIK